MTVHIITIDGPSGSGKGTLAAKIAAHYGFSLLDSGALYRLLGLSLFQHGLLDQLDTRLEQCVKYAIQLDIEFKSTPAATLIFLEGVDVTNTIRTEQVGEYASRVAAVPELRKALFERQRAFIQPPGLVADGRDMATSIFPEAQAKIYLTASAESRAARRVKQLQGMGLDAKISDILSNIQARDKRDMERTVAPLKPAEGAYVIDSSTIGIDDVFQLMVDYIDSRIQ